MGKSYLGSIVNFGLLIPIFEVPAVVFIVYLLFGAGLTWFYAYPDQSRKEKAKNALILPGLALASFIGLFCLLIISSFVDFSCLLASVSEIKAENRP